MRGRNGGAAGERGGAQTAAESSVEEKGGDSIDWLALPYRKVPHTHNCCGREIRSIVAAADSAPTSHRFKMTSKTTASIQRVQKLNHVRQEGPNWVLIAGSALLSTLTVSLGCKLKKAFQIRRQDTSHKDVHTEYRKSASKKSSGACQLHSSLYHFNQDEEVCCYCLSGTSEGRVDVKQPKNPVAHEADVSLTLVEIPAAEQNKDVGSVMWISSPDRLEMPRKPLHHSNSSGSPCISESGSDIYSKREVIQKLRQQLKRRDEMIMEMQAQITDLQNSLNIQLSQSAHLQAQLDCTGRDLFNSEREIQQLRKVIADHCVAEVVSPEKPIEARQWHHVATNGFMNGFPDNVDGMEVNCVGAEKAKAERERIEMLKREVQELKEVIDGKDFLLQSYKEQKTELCSKIKELQLKLASQVPNIL
ncbi:uncharacterized protein LOC103981270 isoform X3 [Musa acuminata AAA Group]|uniref:uncharacterized protein LOC103981270 isoform X3 n=1 Tax=Musa acuminata AAA Group TaxID=214697 RepID=UPI0031DCF329